MDASPSFQRQFPSAWALWAILWRATLWMPVMILWTAVMILWTAGRLAVPMAAALLLMNAAIYASVGLWAAAAGHFAAFAGTAAILWYWLRHAPRQRSTSELHCEGYVV